MRVLEKIFALMLITSVVFWFMRLPYAALLQGVGTLGLVMLYLLVIGRLMNSPVSDAGLGLRLLPMRVGMACAALAFMLWFQTWSWAWVLVLAAVLLMSAGFLLVYQTAKASNSWVALWSRMALWGGLMVVLAVLPTYTHVSLKYADDPAYRDVYLEWLNHREDPEAYEAWRMHHCRKYPLSCGYVE